MLLLDVAGVIRRDANCSELLLLHLKFRKHAGMMIFTASHLTSCEGQVLGRLILAICEADISQAKIRTVVELCRYGTTMRIIHLINTVVQAVLMFTYSTNVQILNVHRFPFTLLFCGLHLIKEFFNCKSRGRA